MLRLSRLALPLLATCLLPLASCGGSSDDDADAAPGSDASPTADGAANLDAPPSAADEYRTDLVGRITLDEYADAETGYAIGWFGSGAELPPQDLVVRAGDCALYAHADPGLCEGSCDGFCTAGGTCLPSVRWLPAGTLTVSGGPDSLTLDPNESNFYTSGAVNADVFAEGSALTATLAGSAEFPAVTLHARGVATLTAPPATIELHGSNAAIVVYTAGPSGGRVQLALRKGWHGSPWETMLLCESEDDGSLDIPAEVVAAVPEFGGIGLLQWPSELVRYSRDIVETSAGPVELFVSSRQVVGWTKD